MKMLRTLTSVLFYLCMFFVTSGTSFAHQLSTGFVNIQTEDNNLLGDISLRWFDIDQALNIDIDGNGELQWKEVVQEKERIINFLQQHIVFANESVSCPVRINRNIETTRKLGEAYLNASFVSSCNADEINRFQYTALFAQVNDHKLVVNEHGSTFILNEDQQSMNVSAAKVPPITNFFQFVKEGVWHIWIGFDHILFLLVLLLPSMIKTGRSGQLTFESDRSKVIKRVILLVSTFTLAHSSTLALAALDIVTLNIQFVEVAIAVSILVCALDNIFRLFKRIYLLIFLFGLLHGFGFSSVLGELTTEQTSLIIPLLAFNIGVELGQLVIVLAVIPLLHAVSKTHWYRRYGMKTFSGAAGLMGLSWAIQRIAG